MPELQRLDLSHAPALLAFELENRVYFNRTISDRGDEFFAHFDDVHTARLAEQEAGEGAFYVLCDDDGAILGRFNLVKLDRAAGAAQVGYRLAERAAGRGVATAALRELCGLARQAHGLSTLRASTSLQNVASQRVLEKAGFVATGPADPADIGGKQGTRYELDLGQA